MPAPLSAMASLFCTALHDLSWVSVVHPVPELCHLLASCFSLPAWHQAELFCVYAAWKGHGLRILHNNALSCASNLLEAWRNASLLLHGISLSCVCGLLHLISHKAFVKFNNALSCASELLQARRIASPFLRSMRLSCVCTLLHPQSQGPRLLYRLLT